MTIVQTKVYSNLEKIHRLKTESLKIVFFRGMLQVLNLPIKKWLTDDEI